jgi:hypothetical protein
MYVTSARIATSGTFPNDQGQPNVRKPRKM